MKIKIWIFVTSLLVLAGTSFGQLPLLHHYVGGKFLNPDSSKPQVNEIKYQGYLTKSPLDTTKTKYCGEEGAWAINVTGDTLIYNAKWVAGDTLVVVFENVFDGEFKGVRSVFRYITTENSPEILDSIALPVEMTTFTARVRSTALAEEVVLEWHTASESDNLGFEVQRCQDNKSFEKIGFMDGSGFSTEEQKYSFVDAEVNVGKYYYRLKQIDRDGSFSYSEVQEITVAAPDRYELSQNFPNPFNPKTDIIFRVRQDGLVVLKVYDILGREVKTLVNKKMNAGTHRISFDGRDLPSGMYLYAITAGGFKDVKKMVLIK